VDGPHWVEVDDLAVVDERVTGLVTNCSQAALLEPTWCVGWPRTDLLFHLLPDAQGAGRGSSTTRSAWAPTGDP